MKEPENRAYGAIYATSPSGSDGNWTYELSVPTPSVLTPYPEGTYSGHRTLLKILNLSSGHSGL